MGLQLGASPDTLTVDLVAGFDFVTGFDSLDGDWPGTATIELRFDTGAVWPASISNEAADWNVDKADVDALIASGVTRATLAYTDGTAELPWAMGPVVIIGAN